jgi:hypothetical protein
MYERVMGCIVVDMGLCIMFCWLRGIWCSFVVVAVVVGAVGGGIGANC